jgi:hypothetical protein
VFEHQSILTRRRPGGRFCGEGNVGCRVYSDRVLPIASIPRERLSAAAPRARLSAAAARRIALAAQGFATPRPTGRADARQVRRVINSLGVLQLDSVNVFCRSHYLPLLSRLGPYPRAVLDQVTAHTAGRINRSFVEYWAHEASLIPIELQPYFRWRMARAHREVWPGMATLIEAKPELLTEVLALVKSNGPIRAGETRVPGDVRPKGGMWDRHDGKVALEYLFRAGEVMAERRVNFERLYDLPERVLPEAISMISTPSEADAQRQLVRIAARALGVATEPDLGDYYRLSRAESKLRVAELVAAGELEPVEVEGWAAPAYLWPDAHRPRRVTARALLSPFDSLIWYRERTERIFRFRYRIEIYTPPSQRVHGYYVLPFLLGDALVARVDLKSDRQAGVLRVQSAFAEAGVDEAAVAYELAQELRQVSDWLGLDRVVVAPVGDLAARLAAAVAARP